MANLIGEGFPGFVVSQIERRQSIYGSINRSNAQLEYLNNRNGWCKLVSSVNVDSPVRGIAATGNELAKNYILFNGTSPTTTGIGGLSGYGLGGTNFGINPMPGIISAEIKTENMGSLKSATVQIKANNRNQFDIIDILYMRLGYSVLLEWGNSNYFNNDGTYVASNPNSLANDFINGSAGTEYQDIFNTINARRKASCGNYDAIVGKVVNFTWSFEKDGTYNITVMIKSMGDILESLKTNTLLPEIKANTDTEEEKTEDEEEATEPTSEEVIKSFKNTHEIGKKFYALQQKLAPLTAGDGGISTLVSSQNNVVAFKQTYQGADEGEGVDQYYIRLGYFLRFVQKALIPQVDDKQVRLIEIDTDTDSNLIYVLGRQMSNNPSICLFKVDVPNGSEIVSFAPGVDDFVYSEINGNKYGRIMNVYFNMTYILNQLDSLKDADTGKVSLYDLINCLCEGFNNATGNFNQLYPAVDADRNKITISDQTVCPDIKDLLDKQGKSTALATFDVYGYYYNNSNNASSAGFIRDLSFQTTVAPNLATMITIGATSNGYIPGQDSTALSRMNAGLSDRFKKKVDLEQKSTTPPSKESLFEDYKDSILSYQTFVSQLGGIAPTWNQEAIDAFSNAASSFYEYDQAKQTLSKSNGQADGKSSPNGGFLPFDLRLTLDGLSGMKIYQKYTIDTAFLPSNYPTSLNFLLKGITNTIENNEWITTLESFAIPANPNGSEVGQSAVAIASGNSRDNTRGIDTTRVQLKSATTWNNLSESQKKNAIYLYNTLLTYGFSDIEARAILGVVSKESKFAPRNEISYGGTSNERIRSIWPGKFSKAKYSDAALTTLKKDKTAFFSVVYGGKYGNNTTGDGGKYIGRGFNQLTFKGNYSLYNKLYKAQGSKAGAIDIITDPDLVNKAEGGIFKIASHIASLFFKEAKNNHFRKVKITTQDQAILLYMRSNAGWGTSTSGAIFQEGLAKTKVFVKSLPEKIA
jgi:predicted chitinase